MTRFKAVVYITIGAILSLTLGVIVYLTVVYFDSLKPDYLTFTYGQNIKRNPPVFHLDETIAVEALFENSGEQDLTFQALVFWRMVHPTRHSVLQLVFSETIEPGCSELSFNNVAPEQVRRFTNEQFAKGADKVVWRIEGSNAVTSPYSGGLQPFKVEDATYIPNDEPLPKLEVEDKLRC